MTQMRKLATGLSGAIGSRYLKSKNTLVFTEYSGFISKIDLATAPTATVVSQGTAIIKSSYNFNCDTGVVSTAKDSDLFWQGQTAVIYTMLPVNGAKIVNMGQADFNTLQPYELTQLNYDTAGITGNNDATNKLVTNDVFCVSTNAGNFCKCKVVTYGSDISIQWMTFKVNNAYARIGSGYNQPEDIVISFNGLYGYVSERTGSIVKVDFNNPNRTTNLMNAIATSLTAPQQLWLDELHNHVYTIEYAANGRFFKIDPNTHVPTLLYTGLSNATGLIVTSDLTYAYISEQGTSSISRIDLLTLIKTTVATNVPHAGFLSWADDNETMLLVTQRDPDNKVVLVDITATSTNNVSDFITGAATRPSSITRITPGNYVVCCDGEVDLYTTYTSTASPYIGIGNLPASLITAAGYADTTTNPAFPFQFGKNSPFGGTLSVMIDHVMASAMGISKYKIMVSGFSGQYSWINMRQDPVTGAYDMPMVIRPDQNGFYDILGSTASLYLHSQLGAIIDTTSLVNGMHVITIQFFDTPQRMVSSATTNLYIDNNVCVATLSMPTIGGVPPDAECGYLKYTNLTDTVTMNYSAAEALSNCKWQLSVTRGANTVMPVQAGSLGAGSGVSNGTWSNTVQSMLGPNCAIKGVAIFTATLYATSNVINGLCRQKQYDSTKSYTFCLAK